MKAEELESLRRAKMGLSAPIRTHAGNILKGIALNAEETKLYVSDYSYSGKVKVIDLANDMVTKTINVGSSPYYLDSRPKSNEIWVTSFDDKIYVINTKKDKVSRTFRTSEAPVSIAFDASGKYAAVGDLSGGTYTHKAPKGKIIDKCQFGDATYGVAMFGKETVYATTFDDSVASVGRKCKIKGIPTTESLGWGLALTSDNKYVVAATHSTSIIDAEEGSFLGAVPHSYSSYFVSSLDGKIVYGTASEGIEKIDPATRTLIKIIPTEYSLYGITMAQKNGYLYATGEYDSVVVVIDTNTDEVVRIIAVP